MSTVTPQVQPPPPRGHGWDRGFLLSLQPHQLTGSGLAGDAVLLPATSPFSPCFPFLPHVCLNINGGCRGELHWFL